MTNEPLYHDAFFAQFYDIDSPWSADRTYCLNLAKGCQSVLDLGCGTGSLAAQIARIVPRVVGVDPARGMLDVARQRDGGGLVTWIEADARHVRLGERFDLICITGHAFQCFLTREDRAAVLATIAAHLSPQGRFIFDSRNPVREEWREWTPEHSRRTLVHPQLGNIEEWHDIAFDAAIAVATYGTTYSVQATVETRRTEARIAFPPRRELDILLTDAGLRVERWLGDWDGSTFGETALEIIAMGSLNSTGSS
jgi:ubiquinone/menaquinone biosynthesis C-methylase UbiE